MKRNGCISDGRLRARYDIWSAKAARTAATSALRARPGELIADQFDDNTGRVRRRRAARVASAKTPAPARTPRRRANVSRPAPRGRPRRKA